MKQEHECQMLEQAWELAPCVQNMYATELRVVMADNCLNYDLTNANKAKAKDAPLCPQELAHENGIW